MTLTIAEFDPPYHELTCIPSSSTVSHTAGWTTVETLDILQCDPSGRSRETRQHDAKVLQGRAALVLQTWLLLVKWKICYLLYGLFHKCLKKAQPLQNDRATIPDRFCNRR